jgi:amidase
MRDPFNAFCTHTTLNIPGAEDGPLAGLTFAAKDNFEVAGYRTAAGNPDWLRTHGPAEKTAPAVQTLLDAGASLIGKTQMDELAFSLAGQNCHYGTPINPRAPERIPGGSSSGSAAATAGGLVDFAIGTDTAGSIRVPANNCGIYGIRPTHGLISLEGIVPFSPSFDTVGWFARTAALLNVVGQTLLPGQAKSRSLRRLLVLEDAFALADKEVQESLRPLVPILAGVIGPEENVVVGRNGFDLWLKQFSILRGAEVFVSLGEWIDQFHPQFGPGILDRFAETRHISNQEVVAEGVGRRETQRFFDQLLGANNLLCLPTAALVAPLRNSTAAVMDRYRTQTLKLTCMASVAGLPQISMPLAACHDAPIGLSLIGGRGQDQLLLDLAVKIETKLGAPLAPARQ